MYSDKENRNKFKTSSAQDGEWISLSEAAQEVPYSAEYLSLLARKKTLPAKKIRGVWYTTLPIVREYMRRQMARSLQDSSLAATLSMSVENPDARTGLAPQGPSLLEFPTVISPEEAKKINETVFLENIVSQVGEKTPPSPAEDVSADTAFSVIPSSLSLRPHLEKERSLSDDAIGFAENVVSAVEEETSKEKTWAEIPALRNEGILKIISEETKEGGPLSREDAYASILFQKFITTFTAFLGKEIEARESFLVKAWHAARAAYGAVLSHKKLFSLFLIFLLLFSILPFRVVSAFFDSAYRGVAEAINDANTVLGFRPGTHENEILLLDQEGKIAIFGNVETEGQFKSFVEDGIAPIYVKSTTKAENLNADYLDDLSSEEFTLAFVTKNGNVTYDDVFFEGKVAVGQTLLVRGAANLLSSLSVDGELSVFGDTNLRKNLTVDGSSYFKALLSAQDIAARHIYADRVNATELVADGVLSVHGNANVDGQIVVQGFGIFQGGVSGDTGTFRRGVSTGGNLSARGDVELGGSGSEISITSGDLWNIDTEGNAVFGGDVTVRDSLSVSATTSVDRLRAGNVGIGTTTPGYEIGVVGSGLFEGLVIAYEGFVGNTFTATSTLSAEGLASFLSGFISSASSTIASTLNVANHIAASSTLGVADLASFLNGFISSASSTVSAPFHVADVITSSSSIAVDGVSLFALTGGSVGIGTTSPGTLLAVQGDAFINDALTV
ncbi:MAG: hypothetical protein HYS73_00475, partial [Parcubacteria group bacterium]|nr:hypothetical protein [Parcubacteria group bacterium]